MFGRRKTVPAPAGAEGLTVEGFTVRNGVGDNCVLNTHWEATPDEVWWHDFCQSAKSLSDGDMSAILASLKSSIEGTPAHLMTSRTSANCDVMGRMSTLQLTRSVEQSDMPPELSEITCCWSVVSGAERHVGKIILELREIDLGAMDWKLQQQAELEVAQFITQLSDEGAQSISSIFAEFDNGAGIKQGLAIEALFEAAGRAQFARDLGIDEDSSQQVGCPVRNWQVTALGSATVTMQLRKLRGEPVH